MASNPPNQVEDQTDEDFFDKLVDDDFEPSKPVPKVTENHGSDDGNLFTNLKSSDNTKGVSNLSADSLDEQMFANLSIDDTECEGKKDVKGEISAVETAAELVDSRVEETQESNSLVELNSVNEFNTVKGGMAIVSESTVSKDCGSGVKEVGWSSFYAESVQNENNDFGSDFFNDFGDNSGNMPGTITGNMIHATETTTLIEEYEASSLSSSDKFGQYPDGQAYSGYVEQSSDQTQDLNSSQYWESLYPGWKYDPGAGQWYQVDSYDSTTNVQGGHHATACVANWGAVSDGKSEVSNLQRTSQTVTGTVTDSSVTEVVSHWTQVSEATSTWNQISQVNTGWNQLSNNNGYPEHMIFDPQYPGWYYDTIAQEWRSLESCTSSPQATVQAHGQQNQNGSIGSLHNNNNFGQYAQSDSSQSIGGQVQDGGLADPYEKNNLPGMNMWQPETVANSVPASVFGGSQQVNTSYSLADNQVDLQKSYNSFGSIQSYDQTSHNHFEGNGVTGFQNLVPGGTLSESFSVSRMEQNKETHFSSECHGNQYSSNSDQRSFPNSQQFRFVSGMGLSSSERPAHPLVTFGFGGKLVVVKANSFLSNSSYGNQDVVGGSISVLNLSEVAMGGTNASGAGGGACDYVNSLCQQSFPGPLVGGNAGSKDLFRWIDESIAKCELPDLDYRKATVMKLLLSLLKIACQHYGKLRSPFGTDTTLRENDLPDIAVAKLFASSKNSGVQLSDYASLSNCVQNLPSEAQIQATASEVQNLLVSGRKKEALQCAQEGQLWGVALVLASQLGNQFYIETVKQMALCQLVAGSPLRTLCLLIAGQPADVFASTITGGNIPGPLNFSQQQVQYGANGMLDDWEENLAVITANRTKDDELVIIHLGDCLWKEKSEIAAAHICYLVAETNFESHSDSARLCLVGADHWKYPRTYASPEAIQRTEVYEYARVLGNSQFVLLPFQPYKIIYAHMLAEVGRVTDSLKYCQAVLKSLKTGRAPEVETWKQLALSLEERIRAHQQGGYTANLAPAKLVGKLLNFFDSTAHKVVGSMPPPVPSTSLGTSVHGDNHYTHPLGSRVSASQPSMAMPSLMPSASMEPISEWSNDGNKKTVNNRSVSEPDFSRNPRQVDSSKETTASNAQEKASVAGGTSRFPRFGFGSQLLQKTVGLVLRPRSGRQAKLGEKNKFYYDEKLKRWVEEGAEPPAEEAAPPPPPTVAAFQNGFSNYNSTVTKSEVTRANNIPEFKSPTPAEHTSGIPPMAPNSNQFSARSRMGVRARYVDTFNKGSGASANSFQPPSVSRVKPSVGANPKFFIPTPAGAAEQTRDAMTESMQENTETNVTPPTPTSSESTHALSQSVTMQRFPSMDNISRKGPPSDDNGSFTSHSRRAASWSGSFGNSLGPRVNDTKPPREGLGTSPLAFVPPGQTSLHAQSSSGSFGDDLHEVEL